MGALTSRQHAGVEEVDIPSNSVYRYPPKSGEGATRAGDEGATLLGGGSGIRGAERSRSPQSDLGGREGGRAAGVQGCWRGLGGVAAGASRRPEDLRGLRSGCPVTETCARGTAAPEGRGALGAGASAGRSAQSPSFPPGPPFPWGAEGRGRRAWHRKHAPVLGGGPGRSTRPQRGTGAGLNSVSRGPAPIDCQRREAENAFPLLMLFQGLSGGERSV